MFKANPVDMSDQRAIGDCLGMVKREGLRASGFSEGAFREQQEEGSTLARIAQPADIAPVAAVLAGDDAP